MKYTAAQRLDRLPVSAFHRRLAAMIGAGLFFDTFDLYMASGIMVALTASGWSTMAMNAQFISAGAFGAMLGAGLAGWLGDRMGRKFTFQFNLILFGLMSIAAALAPSMGWLIVFRLLMGIGLGAEIVVGYATIAEFVPPKQRGRWGAILFFLSTSALLGSSLVSYWVIPNIGWRWMFVIAGAGGLLVWLLRKQMPESPRWLESVGRHAEASEILDSIEAGIIREHGALPEPAPRAAQVLPTVTYRFTDLFKTPLLRSTTLGMCLNIVALSAIYGFVIWLPTFLVKQGLSMSHSLGYTALMSSGSLVGILLAGKVADRWNRKKCLVGTSLLAALLGFLYPHGGSLEATTLIGVLLITTLYFGGTISFSTYVPELFPTELRLRGTGLSSAAGRAASIMAPAAVAVLYAGNGVGGVTLALVGLLLAQACVIAVLGTNTSSRSLESGFHGGH
ncbi:MAG: MFS transporter [Pseudomonadota bacterium]